MPSKLTWKADFEGAGKVDFKVGLWGNLEVDVQKSTLKVNFEARWKHHVQVDHQSRLGSRQWSQLAKSTSKS